MASSGITLVPPPEVDPPDELPVPGRVLRLGRAWELLREAPGRLDFALAGDSPARARSSRPGASRRSSQALPSRRTRPGTGSSSGGSTSGGGTSVIPDEAIEYEVVDGYIWGAVTFFDANRNGVF